MHFSLKKTIHKCHLVGINSILEAVVGLEKTFYQVSEDVGVVEVCAIVYSPNANLDCPISFPFNVSLSTGELYLYVCLLLYCMST